MSSTMPHELNPADEAIIEILEDGRASPTMLANETDYTRQYVHSRLQLLVAAERVRKAGHGVYELDET